jgi:hypothetical protein
MWCPERRLDGDKSWHAMASDKIGRAAWIGTMLAGEAGWSRKKRIKNEGKNTVEARHL